MISLSFEVPHTRSLQAFARRAKKEYNAQVAFYKNVNVVEVKVDQTKKNNVIHLALAHNYVLLQESQ